MADIRDLLSGAAEGPDDGFDAGAVRRRVQQRARRRRAASALGALALVGLTAIGITAVDDGSAPADQVVAGEGDVSTSEPRPTDTVATTSTTDGSSGGGVQDTTTTTTSVAPTTTTTAPPPATLSDGRHFGYLVGYETVGTATHGRFDLAQFFTGDEADAAAAEDGVVAEGEEVENDYYIRNVNDRLRNVPFADEPTITVVDCDSGCESVPAELTALRERPTPTPVWLSVVDGVIMAADEVYLP